MVLRGAMRPAHASLLQSGHDLEIAPDSRIDDVHQLAERLAELPLLTSLDGRGDGDGR